MTSPVVRFAALFTLTLWLVPLAAHAQWVWTPQTGRFINLRNLPQETAELQIEHTRSLMLQGDYRRALRETDKFSQYYGDSEWADDNQFLRGEIKLASGDLYDAAKEFQQVVAAYPDSDLFDQVIAKQYEIGDRLYEVGERRLDDRWRLFRKRPLRQAGEVYSMVIDNEPFTARAAEAQYKVGLTFYARKDYDEAAFEYRRVVEDYAGSDWVDEASFGLAKTYYEKSYEPAYDQTPSQLAVVAVDDFQERFPGDPRADELSAIRTEMRARIAEQRLQTAQYYEKRRHFDSAKLVYQVVADEFGETPAADDARAWLAEHEHVNPSPFKHQDPSQL